MNSTNEPVRARASDIQFLVICLAIAIASYEATNWLPRQANLISLALPADLTWPVSPIFVIPYLSFIPIVFVLMPWQLSRNRILLRQYAVALLGTQIVLDVLYFAVPATVARPNLPVTDGLSWLLHDVVWKLDNPVNTFPSNHVAFSTIAALFVIRSRINKTWMTLSVLWFTTIALSTLFTHQHVIVDGIAGVAIGVACVLLVTRKIRLQN